MALQNVIQISCPKCGMNYELPAEYVGQTGECSQCGFLFAIVDSPEEQAVPSENALQDESGMMGYEEPVPEEDPGAGSMQMLPEEQSAPLESVPETLPEPSPEETSVSLGGTALSEASTDISQTNTVKFSRTKVGMVPRIKDDYSLGLLQRTNPNYGNKGSGGVAGGSGRKTVSAARNPVVRPGGRSPSTVAHVPVPVKKPWWSFLLFWKK